LQSTLKTWGKGEEGQLDFDAMIADMAGGDIGSTGESTTDARRSETEPLNLVSAMQASAMTFSNAELGLGTGLSPDAFSNQWMLELNAATEYRDVIENV
jgi:hypothetical protein